jgi:peroxiredoxin family protein
MDHKERRLNTMSGLLAEQEQDQVLRDLIQRVEALEDNMPKDRVAIGVLSGNLDNTIAAFIIACGAAAFDMQVDLFFTFWATAALRDPKKKVKKGALDTMFGWMLPSSSRKLPLSKMQMAGMGPKMIRRVMKMRGAKSLEELIEEAGSLGVRIHVCTMSMDVMGLKPEELIDYPHMAFVGVGTFVDIFSNAKQCWFL